MWQHEPYFAPPGGNNRCGQYYTHSLIDGEMPIEMGSIPQSAWMLLATLLSIAVQFSLDFLDFAQEGITTSATRGLSFTFAHWQISSCLDFFTRICLPAGLGRFLETAIVVSRVSIVISQRG